MLLFKNALVNEAVIVFLKAFIVAVWFILMDYFGLNSNICTLLLGDLILMIGYVYLYNTLNEYFGFDRLSSDEIWIVAWADVTIFGITIIIPKILYRLIPNLFVRRAGGLIGPWAFLILIIDLSRSLSSFRATIMFHRFLGRYGETNYVDSVMTV